MCVVVHADLQNGQITSKNSGTFIWKHVILFQGA